MSKQSFSLPSAALSAAALALLGATGTPTAKAASHSDAPLIKLDPQANITDVYAFIGMRGGTKVLNVVVQVHPFSEPGDGVIYDKFSDDALYSIHIANPSTGQTLRRYDFRFSGPSAGLKNQNTILSYGLGTEAGPILSNNSARRNYTQTYSLSVYNPSNDTSTTLGSGLITPPPNVGKNTTPNYNDADGFAVSGATSLAALDNYTRDAIINLPSGVTVFAGPREDGFFADTPAIFDLLDSRILLPSPTGFGQTPPGTAGVGVDGFKGFNVLSFAIQIPVSDLPTSQFTALFAQAQNLGTSNPIIAPGATTGIGVYASVSRPRITLRSATAAPASSGPFIQVNRMGNPLFNEVLVALKDKDKYNLSTPTGDNAFRTYAENPEIAALINLLYSQNFQTSGRADLGLVYIPDVLRVDTTTDAVRLSGQEGFSRLGGFGLDVVANGNGNLALGGWPNGRRLGDDVVDIALTAVANGPSFPANGIVPVGDNMATNDMPYNQVFPYTGTPHAGKNHSKDSN